MVQWMDKEIWSRKTSIDILGTCSLNFEPLVYICVLELTMFQAAAQLAMGRTEIMEIKHSGATKSIKMNLIYQETS